MNWWRLMTTGRHRRWFRLKRLSKKPMQCLCSLRLTHLPKRAICLRLHQWSKSEFSLSTSPWMKRTLCHLRSIGKMENVSKCSIRYKPTRSISCKRVSTRLQRSLAMQFKKKQEFSQWLRWTRYSCCCPSSSTRTTRSQSSRQASAALHPSTWTASRQRRSQRLQQLGLLSKHLTKWSTR